MDARDSVRMRYEKRLREGLEDTSGYNQAIGSFERFTKVSRWFLGHLLFIMSKYV